MTPNPIRRLALAISRADAAADRLAAAEHALCELIEERDEDQRDPDLEGKIARAETAVAEATAARDAAVAERQRLERALTGADPDAVRRVHAHLLPPRPLHEPERPARLVRERAGDATLTYEGHDDALADERGV